ncbi:MAG: glycosyltransferase [Oligoflexia bacterium]|nr:glycosyltransferase [Oligoflexia bacterium]
MKIFVHSASDNLTDWQSHGEGLICFSILNGLAERGHEIHAYAPHSAVKEKSQSLKIYNSKIKTSFGFTQFWQRGYEANQLFDQLSKTHRFDLVWRMNPLGNHCPVVPKHGQLPLVLGPFYYPWLDNQKLKSRFGFSLFELAKPLALWGWKNVIDEADFVFAATKPHALEIKKTYSKENVDELPLIINIPSQVKKYSLSPNQEICLSFVGNLVPNKRPDVFIKIIKAIREKAIPARAKLIGNGVMMPELRELAKKLKIDQWIEFMGQVQNAEVPKLLQSTDIFISTAMGEPYGRNIVEAMSGGLVVICHKSGGAADFIRHNVDGMLVTDSDENAFAQCVELILKNESLPQTLGTNAATKSKNWTKENVLSALEKTLTNLIGQVK